MEYEPYIEILPHGGGGWYWRLRAANVGHEIICHSESYTRYEDADRGAKTAQRLMGQAEIRPRRRNPLAEYAAQNPSQPKNALLEYWKYLKRNDQNTF